VRKPVSVAAVFAAALVWTGVAFADSPASVYSDFAEDGILNCGHSRRALTATLNDATLYQYGDPLTFPRLKLAIRKQLAGGCRRGRAAGGGDVGSKTSTGSRPSTSPKSRRAKGRRAAAEPPLRESKGENASNDGGRSGGVVLLAVLLLLLALGSGAWAAKRAFGSER
jgi:hypothetical protein